MNHQQAANKVEQLSEGEYASIEERTSFNVFTNKHEYIVYVNGLRHFISEKNWVEAIKLLEHSIADRKNRNMLPAPHMITA